MTEIGKACHSPLQNTIATTNDYAAIYNMSSIYTAERPGTEVVKSKCDGTCFDTL